MAEEIKNIKGKINELAIYHTDAYELAVKNGYTGTLAEWLAYLKGKSAYELAVDRGYKGTEEEWMAEITANADKAVEANNKAEATLATIEQLLEEYVGEVDALVGGD